jgi:hypothetical protein
MRHSCTRLEKKCIGTIASTRIMAGASLLTKTSTPPIICVPAVFWFTVDEVPGTPRIHVIDLHHQITYRIAWWELTKTILRGRWIFGMAIPLVAMTWRRNLKSFWISMFHLPVMRMSSRNEDISSLAGQKPVLLLVVWPWLIWPLLGNFAGNQAHLLISGSPCFT